MPQMTAVQVTSPGGPFETVQRAVPEPGPHSVRIKIQACGVCHSDVFVKEGQWPGLQYPRVTGHEVAGVIDAVGPGVTIWTQGQRAGVRIVSQATREYLSCAMMASLVGWEYGKPSPREREGQVGAAGCVPATYRPFRLGGQKQKAAFVGGLSYYQRM